MIYMSNLKDTESECLQQNRNKLADMENKPAGTSGEKEGAREGQGIRRNEPVYAQNR